MAVKPIWKHPLDDMFRTLSFSRILPAGVNLQASPAPTFTVTPADVGGLAAALPGGGVSGQAVTTRLTLGNAGVDYLVTVKATADNGEVYNRAVTVKVRTGI